MPVDDSRNFNPERDVPLLTGKVIFITGGKGGALYYVT